MSPELQQLIIEYFKSEVVPDRPYLVDDSDLAQIVDKMRAEKLID